MPDFSPAPGRLPPDTRVYAVGDVHGCADRLVSIHEAIAADLAARPVETSVLVHIGDYIDRGPASAEVVARLASGAPVPATRTINLMGNHEEMMLTALASGDPEAVLHWQFNGGTASLQSWGIPWGDAAPGEWAGMLPCRDLDFLRTLALRHQEGGYLFTHAGLRPGIPLESQSRHDLLWIREPFLSSAAEFGAVVVHGHTPRRTPEVRRNRIGIDTGAVMGGELTCVVLEEDRLAFISR